MTKIQMTTPLVEMDGDEMTRIIWQMIKDELILPVRRPEDRVLRPGPRAPQRDRRPGDRGLRRGHQAAWAWPSSAPPSRPTPQRMDEYDLKQMWKSPNGTIRAMLDGTVFRTPITGRGHRAVRAQLEEAHHHRASRLRRRVQERRDCACPAPARWSWCTPPRTAPRRASSCTSSTAPASRRACTTWTRPSPASRAACFEYALDVKQDIWFATKDTISKKYDHRFKDVFQEIYDAEYAQRFEEAGIEYFYTLIDDAVARVMKADGGFIWACKNYDGDVMSDMVSSAFGSLAMMTSVLVSPARRTTSTRPRTAPCSATTTSTSRARRRPPTPVATIFAWTGALRKRGELDGLDDLVAFADTPGEGDARHHRGRRDDGRPRTHHHASEPDDAFHPRLRPGHRETPRVSGRRQAPAQRSWLRGVDGRAGATLRVERCTQHAACQSRMAAARGKHGRGAGRSRGHATSDRRRMRNCRHGGSSGTISGSPRRRRRFRASCGRRCSRSGYGPRFPAAHGG